MKDVFTCLISAKGNGTVSYDYLSFRNGTFKWYLDEGTSATIVLTPDKGYQIKSLKVNDIDKKSEISNNQYTLSNISANTTVEAEFEAIPPTTYTLSIKATGNGKASYGEADIRDNTSKFTVNEGSSVTVSFTPDEGYRIKRVKIGNTDVTSSVLDNQYTISSINGDTTLEVEFEAIPPTTYALLIKATGNGKVTYADTDIRENTSTFTVNEGTSVTITFSPDNGYRVKSLTVNNTDVKSSISNNQYTISSISANTNVEVEFEAIPVTAYTLSIKSIGNGKVTYADTDIREKTSTFTINEGTNATISLTPDNGYRVKSLTVNDADVKSSILKNR